MPKDFNNGDVVWVHPHGSPETAVQATVELISENGVSIALLLDEMPTWATIKGTDKMLVHLPKGAIAMLLMRFHVGPWIEQAGKGHYEIERRKPS